MIQDGDCEWDDAKAHSNLGKHGISFVAARRVFDDAFALGRDDVNATGDEARYVLIGMVNGVLLAIVYTERGERTRIISARKATKHEHREYYRSQTAE